MNKIELTIKKNAYGGYGLGFSNGKAIFVPFAVPGDIVNIEIYREKKDHSFAKIINFVYSSESRVNPVCPNFGQCGGCDYLNVSYENELSIKKAILIESLSRIAKLEIESIPDISIVSDERFFYRGHALIKSDSCGNFGFFKKDTNIFVPLPDAGCYLLAKPIINKLKNIKNFNAKELKIACSSNNVCNYKFDKPVKILELENGITYKREISIFFQANRFLRSKMLNIVEEYAELNASKNFLDIGCGVGFFTLFLAKKSKNGYGIDINKESINWAKNNAKLNNINNVAFKVKAASNAHPFQTDYHTVIADPPRAGLSKKTRKTINAISPGRIVYVSCNPATFSRDAKDISNYGYTLQKISLIDMFPGTYHIEVMGLFVQK